MTDVHTTALRPAPWLGLLACLGACDVYSDPILSPEPGNTQAYLCGGETLSGDDRDRYEALLGSAFTWVTGSVAAASQIPAIDVAPYCAVDTFLPDVRPSDLGLEMLEVLTRDQRAKLDALREAQRSEWGAYSAARGAVTAALFELKRGVKLDEDGVLRDAEALGQHQGEIANEQLAGLADLLSDLTPAQVQHLAQVAQGKIMPLDGHDSAPQVAAELDALSAEERAIQWSLAAKAFAWSQSPLSENQKLTVRKVGSFFGFGFYRFAVSDMGLSSREQRDALLTSVAALMEGSQRDLLCDLLEDERASYEDYVDKRAALLSQTQGFLEGSQVDTAKVVNRSEELGRIEGRLGIRRAKAFHELEGTLSNQQRANLQSLRQTTEAVSEL